LVRLYWAVWLREKLKLQRNVVADKDGQEALTSGEYFVVCGSGTVWFGASARHRRLPADRATVKITECYTSKGSIKTAK
jgi:hypothetical protein